jgi:hypothetical protein
MNRATVACGLAVACIFAQPSQAATLVDSAAGQFALGTNPNGHWSYGYTDTLGSSFVPYTTSSTNLFAVFGTPGLSGWQAAFPSGADLMPLVDINTNATTAFYGTIVQPPGILGLHPGPQGQYSVVRWTAPAADTYLLRTLWSSIERFPATPDLHTLLNGVSIFDSTMGRYGDETLFSTSFSLQEGDTLDFVVGYGPNHDFVGDLTGLQACVTNGASSDCPDFVRLDVSATPQVPEPASWALAAAGLLGMLGVRRFRR